MLLLLFVRIFKFKFTHVLFFYVFAGLYLVLLRQLLWLWLWRLRLRWRLRWNLSLCTLSTGTLKLKKDVVCSFAFRALLLHRKSGKKVVIVSQSFLLTCVSSLAYWRHVCLREKVMRGVQRCQCVQKPGFWCGVLSREAKRFPVESF